MYILILHAGSYDCTCSVPCAVFTKKTTALAFQKKLEKELCQHIKNYALGLYSKSIRKCFDGNVGMASYGYSFELVKVKWYG